MMKDERGEVIYVGKAASLRARVRSYFQKGQLHPPKVSVMLTKVADVDWLVTDSEVEALMLECNLIKQHRPRYNVRLRDDKHYPYLCVTMNELFQGLLSPEGQSRMATDILDHTRIQKPYVIPSV